jgi:hypothetical protein
MADQHLDRSYRDGKYFIDPYVYNCPFCKRRNVKYSIDSHRQFNWSAEKICHIWFVRCSDCSNISMHLSYIDISPETGYGKFRDGIDIDSKIFYSVPTSSFALDPRVPAIIRELITEAEGCLNTNFLTGASACMRKAIYELTVKEQCEGEDYESKIKFLKKKYHQIDPALFDVLAHIQDMTSDKIHEQSWDKWDSPYLRLIIETLKTVLYEMYVEPAIRKDRISFITQLKDTISKSKKGDTAEK